ncbi:TonB-dependent receptor [soil metagenome]
MRFSVSRSALVWALSFAAVGCSVQAAQAQQAPQEGPETSTLDEIVVTAQRREQRLNDVPIAIAAITGEDLAARGVRDTTDLAKVVPGLSASDSGQNVPVYSLRGIGLNEASLAANPAVAVYVDEVPLPYAGMTKGAALDLARVEVLKGPQGTLYGTNSTGGAINYISQSPTDYFSAGGSVSIGRFDRVDADGYVSGPLSDTLRGRLSLSTAQGGPWQRSTSRSDALGDVERYSGRAQIAWTPTDRFRATLGLNGWIDKSDTQALQLQEVVLSNPANAAIVPAGLIALGDNSGRLGSGRDADWDPGQDFGRDDSFYQASVKANLALSDTVDLTSITAFSRYVTKAFQDRDGTPFRDSGNQFDGRISSFYQELRIAGGNPEALQWIVGANYRSDDLQDRYLNILPDASTSRAAGIDFDDAIIDADTQVQAIGVFANADYKFTDTLSGTVGLRYSHDDRDVQQCTADSGNGVFASIFTIIANSTRARLGLPAIAAIPPGACVSLDANAAPERFHGNLTEDNVSWRGSLNWKPFEHTLVYASIGKGFKAGSFPTVSATSSAQFAPATQESVLAYEIGLKATVIPQRLQINGAVFYYDYRDKQVRGRGRDVNFGLVALLVNVPESVVKGAEVEIVATPLDGLDLRASATYLDGEVRNYVGFDLNATTVRDFAGERLPYTSEWSVNFTPSYEFALTPQLEGFVSADVAYRSGSSAFFGRNPREAIPQYTTLDLSAGVRSASGGWSLTAWGRNVTDEYYWVNVGRSIDTYARVAAMPATYGVTLGFKY